MKFLECEYKVQCCNISHPRWVIWVWVKSCLSLYTGIVASQPSSTMDLLVLFPLEFLANFPASRVPVLECLKAGKEVAPAKIKPVAIQEDSAAATEQQAIGSHAKAGPSTSTAKLKGF